jgi:protein-disulfide isomerase
MPMLKTLGRPWLMALLAPILIVVAPSALVVAPTALVFAPPAMAKTPAAAPAHAAGNWNTKVTRTADDGYILGNPDAPLHLVAYISYTCPHCAEFEAEAFAPLSIGMIGPGKGSFEIRPFLRNGLDVMASLLAECGPPSKFFGNTQLLLATQREWLEPIGKLTEAQKGRWDSPDFGTKMRAIASDLGLYTIMARRGYERVELDRCLADKPLADRMAKHTQEASDKEFVNGTPGFLINGVLLTATYDWAALKPQLDARLH